MLYSSKYLGVTAFGVILFLSSPATYAQAMSENNQVKTDTIAKHQAREVTDIKITAEGDATSLFENHTLQYSARIKLNNSNDWSDLDANKVRWVVGTADGVSGEEFAKIDENGLLTANKVGSVLVHGCYSSHCDNQNLTVIDNSLKGIKLTTENTSLPAGTTTVISASGNYPSGEQAINNETLYWHTSDDSVLKVLNDGTVWANSTSGTADVWAEAHKDDTSIVSNHVTITTNPAIAEEIEISPVDSDASIALGLKKQYQAFGYYSDGTHHTVKSDITWSSSNPSVAEIDTKTGEITSISTGVTEISATLQDISSNKSSFQVLEPELTELTLTPSVKGGDLTVVGAPTSFQVTAHYTNGSVALSADDVYWQPGFGASTIEANGVVIPERECLYKGCTIVASYMGKEVEARYTALDPIKSGIQVKNRPAYFLGWQVVKNDNDNSQKLMGVYGSEYGVSTLSFNDIKHTWGESISNNEPSPVSDVTNKFKLKIQNDTELQKTYDLLGNSFQSFYDTICQLNPICSNDDLDTLGVWSRTEVQGNDDYHIVQPGAREASANEEHYVIVELTESL